MGRWKRFRRRYECFLTSRRYSCCLIYDRVQRKTVPEGVVTLWDDFVRANCGEISSAGKGYFGNYLLAEGFLILGTFRIICGSQVEHLPNMPGYRFT